MGSRRGLRRRHPSAVALRRRASPAASPEKRRRSVSTIPAGTRSPAERSKTAAQCACECGNNVKMCEYHMIPGIYIYISACVNKTNDHIQYTHAYIYIYYIYIHTLMKMLILYDILLSGDSMNINTDMI